MIDAELAEFYTKEAKEHIKNIKESLVVLAKNPDDVTALRTLLKNSHGLKGMSLQMEFYLVGYFSSLINNLIEKVISKKTKLDQDLLFFFKDFTNSLERALDYEIKGKKFAMNPALIKKLNTYLGSKYKKPVKEYKEESIEVMPENVYLERMKKHVALMSKDIATLQKNHDDDNAIESMLLSTNHLMGDSLLSEQYIMGHMIAKLRSVLMTIANKTQDRELQLAFLFDLFNTFKRIFDEIEKKGVIGTDILKKWDLIVAPVSKGKKGDSDNET